MGERPGAVDPLTVTVIVPARDAADTIEATLQGLAAQAGAPPFEVIVVDSGSSDGTPVLAAIAGAKVLHNDGGEPASSRNMGASLAFGDVLAFTDADCAPEPGWLAAGMRALGAGADLVQGAVVPIRHAGPYDRTVSVGGEHGLYETASLFVRREAFERIGGFEPVPGLGIGTGQPFGEDVWFAWRLKRAGARTAFAAGARVRHEVFARGPGGWIWERRRSGLFPPLVPVAGELHVRSGAHRCRARRPDGSDGEAAGASRGTRVDARVRRSVRGGRSHRHAGPFGRADLCGRARCRRRADMRRARRGQRQIADGRVVARSIT